MISTQMVNLKKWCFWREKIFCLRTQKIGPWFKALIKTMHLNPAALTWKVPHLLVMLLWARCKYKFYRNGWKWKYPQSNYAGKWKRTKNRDWENSHIPCTLVTVTPIVLDNRNPDFPLRSQELSAAGQNVENLFQISEDMSITCEKQVASQSFRRQTTDWASHTRFTKRMGLFRRCLNWPEK